MEHHLNDTVIHTVNYVVSKNDTSQTCNWKAALLFGNRFVLKWRYSFTDSHLIVPGGCATHVLSLTVLVARDNDSQKLLFFLLFSVSLFSGKKKKSFISVMLQKNGLIYRLVNQPLEMNRSGKQKASCSLTSSRASKQNTQREHLYYMTLQMLVQTV